MNNRTKNTKRNIISGLINRLASILLPFLIRTAILYVLGVEYMGLNSLFSSILHVLNLAELGFSSAIVFSMYKPISENDDKTICALMLYYKKVYRYIGIGILCVGLVLLPFIKNLINGTWPNDINIYVLFMIYLINTAISYFLFAYKSALLNAFQRIDVVNKIQLLTLTSQYIIQLAILLIFKNYYAYIIISPVSTIMCNLITARYADKLFPQYQCKGKLPKNKKNEIHKQISGLMLNKISDTSRNSFDSIVLSSFFGLTIVAIYNNYFYIYSALYGVMLTITQAMQASVGNSIASETKEKNYNDLRKFTFIFEWIIILCTANMLCIYQPFMKIWAGKELLLSTNDMILFCIYFYLINMNNTRNLYFSGKGLWWAAKTTFLLEAIGNLILNIFLGIKFGITGVLLATIITIFVFNFVFRTNILFKLYFKISPKQFYFEHIIYAIQTLLICLTTYFLCNKIGNCSVIGIVERGIICSTVVITMLFVFNIKNKNSKELYTYIQKMLKR